MPCGIAPAHTSGALLFNLYLSRINYSYIFTLYPLYINRFIYTMYYSSPREASLSMIKAAPSTGLLERFRRVLSSLLKPEKVPEDQVRVNPWWGGLFIFRFLRGWTWT